MSGLVHVHVPARDVLHEDGGVLTESRARLPEERGLSNAAGLDVGKGDAVAVVELGEEEVERHHEYKLGVIIGLGADEVVRVGHINRVVEALHEPFPIHEVL